MLLLTSISPSFDVRVIEPVATLGGYGHDLCSIKRLDLDDPGILDCSNRKIGQIAIVHSNDAFDDGGDV